MAKNTAQPGLFGPTASEVATQVRNKGRATDIGLAQLPQGTAGNLLARGVGRSIGNIAAGDRSDDPAVMKAEKLQLVRQTMLDSGLDPATDREAFLETTASAMMEQGLIDEALNVANGLSHLRNKQQELQAKSTTAQAAALAAQAKAADTGRKLGREGDEVKKLQAQTRKLNAETAKLTRELEGKGLDTSALEGLPNFAKMAMIATAMREDPAVLNRFGGPERLQQFEDAIEKAATQRGVPADIIFSIMSKVQKGGLEPGSPHELTDGERTVWNLFKNIGILESAMDKGIPLSGLDDLGDLSNSGRNTDLTN